MKRSYIIIIFDRSKTEYMKGDAMFRRVYIPIATYVWDAALPTRMARWAFDLATHAGRWPRRWHTPTAKHGTDSARPAQRQHTDRPRLIRRRPNPSQSVRNSNTATAILADRPRSAPRSHGL